MRKILWVLGGVGTAGAGAVYIVWAQNVEKLSEAHGCDVMLRDGLPQAVACVASVMQSGMLVLGVAAWGLSVLAAAVLGGLGTAWVLSRKRAPEKALEFTDDDLPSIYRIHQRYKAILRKWEPYAAFYRADGGVLVLEGVMELRGDVDEMIDEAEDELRLVGVPLPGPSYVEVPHAQLEAFLRGRVALLEALAASITKATTR